MARSTPPLLLASLRAVFLLLVWSTSGAGWVGAQVGGEAAGSPRGLEEAVDPMAQAVAELRHWRAEVLADLEEREPPPLPPLTSMAEGEAVDAYLEKICIQLGVLLPERGIEGEAPSPTIRGWLADRRRELDGWRSDRRRLSSEARQLGRRSAATSDLGWQTTLRSLEEALEERERRWIGHLERGYLRLAELKRVRRRLRPEASAALEDRLRDGFGRQVEAELWEIPDQLMLRLLRLAGRFDRMVGDAKRLSWLRQQLVLSAELAVLLLLWSYSRSRAGGWLASILRLFEYRRQEHYRTDAHLDRWSLEGGLATLAAPAVPMVVSSIDFLAVALLQGFLFRHLPLVGLVGLFWLVLLAGRVAVRAAELAVVTPEDSRPGLMVVAEDGKAKLSSSLRWAMGLVVIFFTLRYLAHRVLDADGLASLVTSLAVVVTLLYGLWMLDRWQGALRWRASLLAGDRMARWIGAEVGRFGAWVRSAVAVVYLATLGPLRVLVRWFGHRRELAWLGEALARQDLDEGRSVRLPLEATQRRAILEIEPRRMERPIALRKLDEAFDDWRDEQRRGLVLVLGNKGMGKSHFLDWAAEKLVSRHLGEGEGPLLQIERLRPSSRLVGAGPALVWLARALDVALDEELGDGPGLGDETCKTLERRLRRELEERPPTLFAIDDLQYLMLRKVGGFAALQAVLAVLLGSAERHFWLVSFHKPSWIYLQGLALDIAEDMFRAEIELLPWTGDQLRDWLEDRTRRAGFVPVYDRLLRWGSLRRETAGPALQRAITAYWRLLVERSHGNPEIATVHWFDSLCRSRSERRLAVMLFDLPAIGELDELDDDELFVLTALTIHGRLTTDQLTKVLNLSSSTVVVACRHLAGLGILERSGAQGFATAARWRMSIHRHLRQKNFLFGDRHG